MSSTPLLLFTLVIIKSCAYVRAGDAFPFLPTGSEFNVDITFPSNFIHAGNSYNAIQFVQMGSLKYPSEEGFLALCCFLQVKNGAVLSRLSTDKADLQKVAELARQYEQFGPCYSPLWLYVATWSDVGTAADQGGNSLQVVIATDGRKSFCLLDYGAVSQGASSSAVMISSDSTHFDVQIHYSLTTSAELPNSSNIGVPGRFLFRVDELSTGLPSLIADADKCEDEQHFLCKPGVFFSKSQQRCVSRCNICKKVGEYVEYPGVWWEGPEKFLRSQSLMTNVATARSDCEAQCTADLFCVAFSLREMGGDIKCTLMQSYFKEGQFKYKESGATFFHKMCR